MTDKTPYEGWYGSKPNVAHLWEFGAPIWVLLQGQNVACKILLKSKRHAYVGYNDASKSVLYYNAETQKVLTSCNYVFLTLREKEPDEEIVVKLTPTHEGEYEETNVRGVKISKEPAILNKPAEPDANCKRKEPPRQNEPCQTRGIQKDYRQLANPFTLENETDDEEKDDLDNSQMILLMAEAGDEFYTLKEAKESPNWPKWEIAI